MKLKHMLMLVGLLVAGWLAFFSDKSPDSDTVEATVTTTAHPRQNTPKQTGAEALSNSSNHVVDKTVLTTRTMSTATNSNKTERTIPILELLPRTALISDGQVGLDGKKLATRTMLFATQSWVPAPVIEPASTKRLPPPDPVAPPLMFVFLGKKLEEGVWEVYLAKANNSYIARAHDVLDGTYRVDAVTPSTLTLTYLPLNQVQRLNIGEMN